MSTNASTAQTINNGGGHEMRLFYPSLCDPSPSYDIGSGDNAADQTCYHQIEKKWEIPRQNLVFEKVIGEGEFGKVMSARILDRSMPSGYKRVAIKMIKSHRSRSSDDIHDLIAEFEILKDIQHPHVIAVLGVCTSKGGPVCIVMEYAGYGSLRDYLRRSRGILEHQHQPQSMTTGYLPKPAAAAEKNVQMLRPHDILTLAWQIAHGMEYLARMKLVHRDLAARNVLLSEGMICKISDFGLTRDVYVDDTYWKKSNGRSM